MIQIFHSNLAIGDLVKKCKIMSQFYIRGRGSDFKPKRPIFYVPKCLGRGRGQARMGQCHIFLFFFLFEDIPYHLNCLLGKIDQYMSEFANVDKISCVTQDFLAICLIL